VSTVVVLVVLAIIIWLVVAPLRSGHTERVDASAASARDELEALKEAKYREIRDAELDYRTGKLSEADYRATDRALRKEAVDILRRIDDLG
jgi:flagellar biosynthesis/type III secretory pathway M-ring protein FliF/YscJ